MNLALKSQIKKCVTHRQTETLFLGSFLGSRAFKNPDYAFFPQQISQNSLLYSIKVYKSEIWEWGIALKTSLS